MAVQTPIIIGGSGGSEFSYFDGTDGNTLEKIEVYAAENLIRAITVKRTHVDAVTFGKGDEGELRHEEFVFQSAELITRLSSWDNDQGTRTGWIYFETDQGRKFDFGMYKQEKKQESRVDVASGICIGVVGRSAWDIDALGFVFLNPISSSKLVDVQYSPMPSDGIQLQILGEYNQTNKTNKSTPWEFKGSSKVTASSLWSVTNGLALRSKPTVEVGIPVLVKVGERLEWKLSAPFASEIATSTTGLIGWTVFGSLQPSQSVILRAVVGHGTVSIDYSGNLEVTFKNGPILSYPLKGQYSGGSHSSVTVTEL